MPDIELKPTMDKPKILEISRGPKDAGSILKEQYEAQQAQRQPANKSPVQYATDKVETTARRGTEVELSRMVQSEVQGKKILSSL